MDTFTVLAIETSCDDTSVALVDQNHKVISSKVMSQDLAHKPFGGIVPEVAGRNHSENLMPMIEQMLLESGFCWEQISGISVTNRPGLVGSLLVGVVTAKSLALLKGIPFVGVNHIEGHIWAPFLGDNDYAGEPFDGEFLSLVVSGGHSHIIRVKSFGDYEILGKTIDDAAGEAFDKFAKMIGLGYPGGAQVDQKARRGDARKHKFPRPLLNSGDFNFSFSGLKTAALNMTSGQVYSESEVCDLCASFQEAVVDVLAKKLIWAAETFNISNLSVTGGVSANSRLRQKIEQECLERGYDLRIPPLRYCTDNAAMIGLVGLKKLLRGEVSDQELGPSPKSYDKDLGSSSVAK